MEIKRIEKPPFNFVLYDDGEIRVSSNGVFISTEDNPNIYRKARRVLQNEMQTRF